MSECQFLRRARGSELKEAKSDRTRRASPDIQRGMLLTIPGGVNNFVAELENREFFDRYKKISRPGSKSGTAYGCIKIMRMEVKGKIVNRAFCMGKYAAGSNKRDVCHTKTRFPKQVPPSLIVLRDL